MVYESHNGPYRDIEAELDENTGIYYSLGSSGILHMERKLPFLLVYRPQNYEEHDMVIENLLKNEASYMIVSADEYPQYQSLLKKLVKKLSDDFGAFLLLEFWDGMPEASASYNTATFNLYGPEELPETTSRFKNYLGNMNLVGMVPEVHFNNSESRCPPNQEPLLERKVLKRLECLLAGLEIEPFYKDSDTGRIYPLLERRFYSEFSLAIRKAVFDFVKVQASHNLSGFQSLARREIMPEVWEIDRQLVEVDNRIKFLMLVSPVNGTKAWKEFKKNNYSKAPVFHYRMIPDDPEILKRKLYNIKIESIDDPTLSYLFREKRAETDKLLTMLAERESPDFLYGSLQLYGGVDNQLLSDAKNILEVISSKKEDNKNHREYFDANEFAELARRELLFLKKQWPGVADKVEIKDTIDSMLVDKGVFYIPEKTMMRKERAEAMIQHEIGTHVVTWYNGRNQPLKLLSSGVPGYEELQEGIAVLAEYLAGGLSAGRMKELAGRVIAVDSLVNHQDFVNTFELLTAQYHFKPRKAFFITTRVYRAGGLTKDAIYLRGFIALINFLKKGNSLEPLLIGKIRQNYLPVIEELIARKVLKPLPIKPRYLIDEKTLDRLAEIRNKKLITEFINFEI